MEEHAPPPRFYFLSALPLPSPDAILRNAQQSRANKAPAFWPRTTKERPKVPEIIEKDMLGRLQFNKK